MRLFIVMMIIFCLWVCTAPLSHPETLKDQPSQLGQLLDTGTSQALEAAGEELGNPIATVRKEYSQLELERTEEGMVDTYEKNGKLKTRWTLQDGSAHGPAITYYDDGEIKYIDLYEDGRRLSRKKYNRDGRLIFEQPYTYEASVVAAAVKIPEPAPQSQTSALVNAKPADAVETEIAFKEIQSI